MYQMICFGAAPYSCLSLTSYIPCESPTRAQFCSWTKNGCGDGGTPGTDKVPHRYIATSLLSYLKRRALKSEETNGSVPRDDLLVLSCHNLVVLWILYH